MDPRFDDVGGRWKATSGGLPARCHVLHASQYAAYAIGSRRFDDHTARPPVPVRNVCFAWLAAEGGKRAGF